MRCECSLCLICARVYSQWETESGQLIQSITTRTQPPFNFAYMSEDIDMTKMMDQVIVEPTITLAWHEAVWKCCKRPGALVVDVGGNFGWYTLYSIALGCKAIVFEPVPSYQEVMLLGASLNPGFTSQLELYSNVVYDKPGTYSLRVPRPTSNRPTFLGMTSMDGAHGILKSDSEAPAYIHNATSVRIDDLVQPGSNVCLLKVDVEGYEPQVLQTAAQLLGSRSVAYVQLEMTRTHSTDQKCAYIRALDHLAGLGYEFRQIANHVAFQEVPASNWREATVWANLSKFPSRPGQHNDKATVMQRAFRDDFRSFSTNLLGKLGPIPGGAVLSAPWPGLDCGMGGES